MFASPWKDAVIVLVIVLLFFGPKRLPALSRSIGESVREFKGGIAQSSDSEDKSELQPSAGSETVSAGNAPAQDTPTSSAPSEPTKV